MRGILSHLGGTESLSNAGRSSIGKSAKSLIISDQLAGYSKVIINVTKELYYQAGNDTGRTLELDCPWGTQAMANNILASLSGFQYQPFDADDALIDPAIEIGDGLTINGVYGGVFHISGAGNALHKAKVAAPHDEEIDHEYKFVPKSERKIERRLADVQSELNIQAGQIDAKVSKTGGSDQSFAWQLFSSGFLLKSGNKTVFQANSSGITVTGQMNATSGYIGDGSNGFLISARSISNGKSGLSDGNNGVYIGTDGIALGPNFKVDSNGNLTANSGTFTGAVHAGNIQYGGSAGTFSGSGITSRSIGTGRLTSGINTSLGNADYAADVFSGAVIASYGKFYTLQTSRTFSFQGRDMRLMTLKNVSQNTLVMCVPFV